MWFSSVGYFAKGHCNVRSDPELCALRHRGLLQDACTVSYRSVRELRDTHGKAASVTGDEESFLKNLGLRSRRHFRGLQKKPIGLTGLHDEETAGIFSGS